tara:strand:+ start:72 stop:242 length:171 start_codon:yes stop_codon:yes gene_type:complete
MSTPKKPKREPVVTDSTAEFLWEIQNAALDKKDEEIQRLEKELEEVRSKISDLEKE